MGNRSQPPGSHVFCESKHDFLCDIFLEYFGLSYDVASVSEIRPCNKIDKPLVVYRFSENVMNSITILHT